jgi:hypothetical protein
MMTGTYSQAIKSALYTSEPRESVDRIKDAVSDAIRDADDEAQVFRTSHFNHSYSPDLVVEWPRRSGERPRPVFLRATQQLAVLEEDVEIHEGEQAIFIHLDELHLQDPRVDENHDQPTAKLAQRARSTRALVTQVESFEKFLGASDPSAAHLLASSVIRGGRGFVDEVEAELSATRVSDGFVGARRADAGPTAAAVEEIEELLDPAEAYKISSVLEAVWLGSGASAYEFPGPQRSLGGVLTPETLRFILTLSDVEDADFWIRVGKSVELRSFFGMHLVGSQPALQKLIHAALPRLRAKACSVREAEPPDDPDPFRWQVLDGHLSIRGNGLQAWITERVGDLPPIPSEPSGPSISELRRRAVSAGIGILEVEATNGQRSLRYSSESATDISGDEDLPIVSDAFGDGAWVRKASTRFRTGQHFEVNFEAHVGKGRTTARPTVADVVWSTWSLLYRQSDIEANALRGALRLDEVPDPTIGVTPDIPADDNTDEGEPEDGRYFGSEEMDDDS